MFNYISSTSRAQDAERKNAQKFAPSKAVRRRQKGMERRVESASSGDGCRKPGSQNPRKYSR